MRKNLETASEKYLPSVVLVDNINIRNLQCDTGCDENAMSKLHSFHNIGRFLPEPTNLKRGYMISIERHDDQGGQCENCGLPQTVLVKIGPHDIVMCDVCAGDLTNIMYEYCEEIWEEDSVEDECCYDSYRPDCDLAICDEDYFAEPITHDYVIE